MRRFGIVTLALAVMLAVASVASADNLVADGDNAAPIESTTLNLGTVCVNSTIPLPAVTNNVLLGISRNGNYTNGQVFRKSTTVTVSVLSTTGTGLSATMVAPTFTVPSSWDTAANNDIAGAATSKVTLAAGATAGAFSGTVNYRSTGTKAGDGTVLTRDTTLNVTATISDTGACAPAPPDTSAPIINCTPNVSDGVWHASNVTVNCTASDASGLAIPAQSSFTLSTSVAPDNEDASASTNSLEVCDTLSNCATGGPITGWMIDRKAPQLTSCDTSDGLWHASDVTLSCHYVDGGAGPANQDVSLSTSVASGAETANASASAGGAQACDAVSNCADSPADILGNMIDKKAPELSGCGTADGLWHATDVTLHCLYTDGGSGAGNLDVGLSTNVAAGTETSNATASAGGTQACDDVNNCAESPADIDGNMIDKKAPELSSCDTADGLWHATDVTLHCLYTDGGSGAGNLDVSLSTNVASGAETANASASAGGAQACDDVSNCADSPADIDGNMIDKKAPELTTCDSADGLWHATDVTLTCHYTDGGSGPANQDVDLSTSVAAGTETANASASAGGAQACDDVSNCADSPADIDGNMIDKKAPELTTCDSADGLWHATDVTLSCHYTDGGVGPANQDVDLSTNVATGTETANATASAGGAQACDDLSHCADSPADISGNMIDKKAPELSSCDTADGLWHATDVTLSCHYTDGGAGPANQDVDLSTSVAAGTETANASASAGGAQACDDVSNCANSPADIAGNKIDKKGPYDVTFAGLINNGDSYYFGSVPPNNSCSATDDGSGFASCGVTGHGTGVGAHTLTATALDNVGNSGSSSIGYSVLAWTLRGFYHPVDMNGYLNTVKGGSTVPLKFHVFAGPTELTSTSVVESLTSTKIICGGAALEDPIEATVTGQTSLRYDSIGRQFIYNWQTPKTPGVCYRIVMKTDDDSTLVALFKMK